MFRYIFYIFVGLVLVALAVGNEGANADEHAIVNTGGTADEITMRMDADGWVYEGEDCDGIDRIYGKTTQFEYSKGGKVFFPEGWYYHIPSDNSYYYYASYGQVPAGVESTITYDYCEMEYWGAGSRDYWRLYAHEQAHSRGLDHGEQPASSNPAYEEVFIIRGY